jgi:hypothetical protein
MSSKLNLRINKVEECLLQSKMTELNRVLVGFDLEPIRKSEIAHLALRRAIKHVKVNKNGVYVDLPL